MKTNDCVSVLLFAINRLSLATACLLCYFSASFSFATVAVDQTFFSNPFDDGWKTNNSTRYFWDSDTHRLEAKTYTNSGEWATTAIDYHGESFHLQFDVKLWDRDTGDVCIGLFGPEKISNGAATEERVFIAFGSYSNHIVLEGYNSGQELLDSGYSYGKNRLVDGEWHHVELRYDSTLKLLDLQVTSGGTAVLSWQKTMNFGFSSDLSYLGISSKGEWETSNRYASATIDNVKMNSVPEPSTLAIWSLLGLCGIAFGWQRRRKA